MKRKKILFFINDLGVSGGGWDLVKYCTRLDGNRFEAIVAVRGFSQTLPAEVLQESGVKIINLEFYDESLDDISQALKARVSQPSFLSEIQAEPERIFTFFNAKINNHCHKINSTIQQFEPDYIHVFDMISLIYVGITINCYHPEIKFIASRISENSFKQLDYKEFDWLLQNFIHPRIDRYYSNSAFITDQLLAESISPERIHQIYNGIDTEVFKRREAIAVESREEVIITIVANYVLSKGYLDLFQAIALVVKATTIPLKLLCAGRDSWGNSQDMNEVILQLGIAENVFLLGEVHAVPELLNFSQIFVLPSHSEALGNAIIEAMSCELPVVATAVGGIPEVVVMGVTGLLVPPKDPQQLAEAILWLFDNPLRARQMGLAGRIRAVQKFSLDRAAREFQNLYEL
ncbi:MAG: glycosyltransferase family 4 protein [Candidatus Pacebacteria bacterium]|nr:glycosyltransferase family 4 protein [Candidatus Paceibacterota bacterium]